MYCFFQFDPLSQWPLIFLATGTGFVEDNFFMDWGFQFCSLIPPLTSSYVARFPTGHGMVPVWGLGVGDPCSICPKQHIHLFLFYWMHSFVPYLHDLTSSNFTTCTSQITSFPHEGGGKRALTDNYLYLFWPTFLLTDHVLPIFYQNLHVVTFLPLLSLGNILPIFTHFINFL